MEMKVPASVAAAAAQNERPVRESADTKASASAPVEKHYVQFDAGPVELVVGINRDGQLMGIKVLNHKETPGLGAKSAEPAFSGQFKDKKVDELTVTKTAPSKDNEIQAISGATITSRAVASGVNAALKYWKINYKDGGTAKQTGIVTVKPQAVSSASKTAGGGNQ